MQKRGMRRLICSLPCFVAQASARAARCGCERTSPCPCRPQAAGASTVSRLFAPYRTLYARNRKDSIIYKVSVAYSPWMEHASLVLMRERRDCCRMKMLGVEPVITDLTLTSPFHVPQGQVSISQGQMAVSQGQAVNLPEQTAIPQAVTERHEMPPTDRKLQADRTVCPVPSVQPW